jgi:hypothetical protein
MLATLSWKTLAAFRHIFVLLPLSSSLSFQRYLCQWRPLCMGVCNLFVSFCPLISTVHPSGVAIYHLLKGRRVNAKFLAPHLKSRDSALSSRQYYRLMAMSMLVGIWGIVWISIDIQQVRRSVEYEFPPLPSWKVIHEDDYEVVELPTIVLGQADISADRLIWWAVPGAAFLFFILFGTSYDVLSEYLRPWTWFRTVVLRRPPQQNVVTTSTMIHSRYAYIFLILFLY